MTRRTYIIATILVIIAGSLGLYFLVGGKSEIISDITSGLPFGTAPEDSGVSPNGPGTSPDGSGGPTDSEPSSGVPVHFFKISETPVAGFVGITKNNAPQVRYVDRGSGHVLDVNLSTLERVQIVNTTMPKIYQALWKADGSGFIARGVLEGSDTVESRAVTLIPPKATSTSSYKDETVLLRGNIGEIAVNPDGSLLYNLKDTGVVATASFTGERPRTLFSLPFTDWRFVPASASTALIFPKASNLALGYAYSLSLSSGNLTKLIGPELALTALLSPDGRRLAFTYVKNDSLAFSVLNVSSKSVQDLFPIALAEKCVWSKKSAGVLYCAAPADGFSSTNIDLWYQGLIHYVDKVWKINTDTGAVDLVLDPVKSFDVRIDAQDLTLTPDEGYLLLGDKNDLSLWALKLP